MKKRAKRSQKPTATGQDAVPTMGAAAALTGTAFQSQIAGDAVPETWDERAVKAWEYYQQEPLVSNAINAWRTFALGDEIAVRCEDKDIEKEAQELFGELGLNDVVGDMISQLLVKGDAVAYFVRTKAGDNLQQVICVNPVSVKFTYENGELVEAIQTPVLADGSIGEPIPLALEQLLHITWNSPEFETRGNSMVLPAFEAIELLRDYRRAERAIARRWATPMRFIQVGGAYGGRIITPDQKMLERVRDEIERMDLKSGLVVPFYVKAETYGAEGISLNTEAKVKETKEDILVALGLARGIVTGDGPNFATASVSMQKMIVQLKEIKEAARKILDWVFEEWLERKGYEDAKLHYQFSDLDLNAEVDQKKLLIDLYDRGLISKSTLQQKMGLSPEVEEKGRKDEEIVVDRNWSVQEISQLVALEVLTVEEARERLGLKKSVKQAKDEDARADVERIYAKHG